MDKKTNKHIILIDVVAPDVLKQAAQENLTETISLINTYGEGEIVQIIQRRSHPHPGTYIGTGKAEEVSEIIRDKKIDIVIINGAASLTQLYHLTQLFWTVNPQIEVWDRVDLILQIFDKHARTSEAKLQIELARMRHMGPRMYGLSGELGRQGGGIGTRGIGETNVERMKRHFRDQIKKIKIQLDSHALEHKHQLERRRKIGYKTASIVGYTNAGKTTIFNRLTGKDKLEKNVLFATLDSATGNLYLPKSNVKILISDTIGFIKDLPAHLVEAFKSTLMESIHADIILYVIDSSDNKILKKMDTVETILSKLDLDKKTIIYVFNKSDELDQEEMKKLSDYFASKSPIFVSGKTGEGIDLLKKLITTTLS